MVTPARLVSSLKPYWSYVVTNPVKVPVDRGPAGPVAPVAPFLLQELIVKARMSDRVRMVNIFFIFVFGFRDFV
jgi:hypothetical protein